MKKVILGTYASETGGEDLQVDLQRLIQTRMLVTAQSGAGKSWALRRLLEQTHGQVQHLVIDPEGEFFTLREKFDYVLARPGGAGDCQAHPRSAGELATSLLEVGVSGIMDIYDLAPRDRILFVKNFLDGLINAPKGLQHPALIVLDESPFYCPQDGDAESSESVWNLMVMGRKRGFCGILAAQRISMIHKNAIAQAGNYLIGRSTLDIDVKRACGVLGFSTREGQQSVHGLGDGEFFAYGSALSREVRRVHVGPVTTTHPKAGSSARPVATPAAIQKVLDRLSEIPQEAERKAQTLADLKARTISLEKELREAKRAAPAAALDHPDALKKEFDRGALSVKRELAQKVTAYLKGMRSMRVRCLSGFETARQRMDQTALDLANIEEPTCPDLEEIIKEVQAGRFAEPVRQVAQVARPITRRAPANGSGPGDSSLPDGERAILIACAQYESALRKQLTILTGYKRSTRDAYIQRLAGKGFVEVRGDSIAATEAGIAALGSHFEPLPTGEDLQQYWLTKLPEGESKILQVLLDAGGSEVSRDRIEETTGFKRSTRDAYIQRLKARQVIDITSGGVRASEDLF